VGRVDLHVHSTASDGRLSPEEVIAKAAGLGLTYIALTDHDTVDGIVPALAAGTAFPELTIIPGIEISTDTEGGQAHVLGYFIDYTDTGFTTALEGFRSSRERRARGMVARLAELGITIDWERVRELAGDGSIGRPHIAQAMLEKGHIKSFREAFDRYIGAGGPAYVERDKMTPVEAVELIVRAGGLPVLAHPLTVTGPEDLVIALKAAGLVGIECYYKDYSHDEIDTLAGIAAKHGLVPTGGTDYHGIDVNDEVMLGSTGVPVESVERLISLAHVRTLRLAKVSDIV